jgi:hypothetical protein
MKSPRPPFSKGEVHTPACSFVIPTSICSGPIFKDFQRGRFLIVAEQPLSLGLIVHWEHWERAFGGEGKKVKKPIARFMEGRQYRVITNCIR